MMLNSLHNFASATNSSLLLVGYSGYDIDLYPFLCNWNWDGPIWWLDRAFGEKHLVHSTKKSWDNSHAKDRARSFGLVERPFDNVVDELLDVLASSRDPHYAKLCSLHKGIQAEVSAPHNNVDQIRDRLVSDHCRSVVEAVSPNGSDSRRLLALAQALRAKGENRTSMKYVGRFLSAIENDNDACTIHLRSRAMLVKAALEHEFCRYIDSHNSARDAGINNGEC